MTLEEQNTAGAPMEVHVPELKALFFVKSFEGDPKHQRSNDPSQGGAGRRLRNVLKTAR